MPSITVNASPAKVWDVLTRPEKRKQWLFGVDTETDWKVGGPIVHVGEWDGKPYEDKGVVKTFDPQKRLVHTHWSAMSGKPDKAENYETVSLTLREQGGATEVTVEEQNVATGEQREMSEQMWAQALGELKRVAEAG